MMKGMLSRAVLGALLCSLGATAQSPSGAAVNSADPLQPLHFLEGTWTAHGTGQGATSDGTYLFRRELKGHVLARHAKVASCKGPDDFDCQHGDLLYVFAEMPGQPLKAIYLDNEGHVIHYNVTMPDPTTAMFLSDASGAGPQFRLLYTLKDGQMSGSFAMQMPGQTEWRPYLTWRGAATK